MRAATAMIGALLIASRKISCQGRPHVLLPVRPSVRCPTSRSIAEWSVCLAGGSAASEGWSASSLPSGVGASIGPLLDLRRFPPAVAESSAVVIIARLHAETPRQGEKKIGIL